MNRITSLESYKGTWLEKLYKQEPVEAIKLSLKDKLEKGVIDRPLYDSALNQLENLNKVNSLEKAGDGKRPEVGKTYSGKSIYHDGKHSDYEKFHENDHHEAGYKHQDIARKERDKKYHYDSLSTYSKMDGDKDKVKEYEGLKKEAEDKEKHHTAQSEYHFGEAKPKQERDRSDEIRRKVKEIKKS